MHVCANARTHVRTQAGSASITSYGEMEKGDRTSHGGGGKTCWSEVTDDTDVGADDDDEGEEGGDEEEEEEGEEEEGEEEEEEEKHAKNSRRSGGGERSSAARPAAYTNTHPMHTRQKKNKLTNNVETRNKKSRSSRRGQ